MNTSFIMMMISASVLPLLAFLTILLRRNFFTGKIKIIFLGIGTILLGYAIIDAFGEHTSMLTIKDAITSVVAALMTLFILSRFSHGHKHALEEEGAKGIVISEAFHSLIDGAVIGATYLINPYIGYAATLGIVIHELPKILGTLTLFRSIGLSVRKTILYGIAAQIGSPIAALLVYLLGKQFNEEQFIGLELASISSFAAIVVWIIYLEIRYHVKHSKSGHSHDH